MNAPLRGQRDEAVLIGYQAPIRKSLIDQDEICGCPRYAFLGLTFICGLLYLEFLPGTWLIRALFSGGLWLIGLLGMWALTRRDAQWLEVGYRASREPDALES